MVVEHQQSDGGRARQSMHDSDCQRPEHLVQANLLQGLRERALRRFFQVQVNFRSMRMHVLVALRAMLMRMGMHNLGVRMPGGESVGDPLRDPGKVQHAQQNEHEADRQFHREPDFYRDRQVENDDARSHYENRQSVT